jgi:protein TonB
MANDEEDNLTTPFVREDAKAETATATPAAGAPATAADPHRSPSTPAARTDSRSMFGGYAAAKQRKLPKWAVPLLTSAVIVHVIIFLALWIDSIWQIEGLDRPKLTSKLSMAPEPPPPPPPPPGGAKPQTTPTIKPKTKVKDIVQPVKIEKQEPQKVEESGDPAGEEGGVEGGVAGGVIGGDLNGVVGAPPPPPPPPPPPAAPQNVPPTLLEGSRIAGEKQIVPDDVTKTEIMRSGKTKIIASFKLCLDAGGTVTSVKMLKSSGFPAYDSKIQNKMRGEWKYKPYAVNGRAVPVCTAVTFIYSQK